MDTNIWQLALNSSGAALVTGLFVYYLRGRDRNDQHREDRFNTIIQENLKDSTRVKEQLAEKLQRNTDVLERVERTVTQQNKIINFSNTILKKIDGKVSLKT